MRIGIIAAMEKEIKKKMPYVNVINKACPLLAQMAEEGWIKNKVAKHTIKEYLKVFKYSNIQKLVLGCTHYPLFTDLIKKELGKKVEIINTGENVANYLKKHIEKTTTQKPNYEFYLTDLESEFIKVAYNILGKEIEVKLAT